MSGIGYHIARRYLARANARHVGRHPQLACYSFDLITQFIHLDGRYENDELQFLEQHIFPQLDPGGLCLDIGANIGNHAVAFAPHFARVLAFEPNPRTFRLLEVNAGLAPNITALPLGASSRPGRVAVSLDPLNIAAAAIGRTGGADQDQAHFDLVRLDDLPELADGGVVSFVKIDVEGHERPALEGAAETLRRHRPLIAMEVLAQDVRDGSTDAVEFLRRLGYDHFYELHEGGWLGRLPRKRKRAARTLLTILTGRRPSKAKALARVGRLEPRSYLMLLCATGPLGAA